MCKTYDFVKQYVAPFGAVNYFNDPEVGYIVWRNGTGHNVEILHIRAVHPGKGTGRILVRKMLEALEHKPPYHSVFVFFQSDNSVARDAYERWGFTVTEVQGLYKEGGTSIGTIPYEKLKNAMGV